MNIIDRYITEIKQAQKSIDDTLSMIQESKEYNLSDATLKELLANWLETDTQKFNNIIKELREEI